MSTFLQRPGRVALVGAGPGDPELLTVRALRLLAAADVVVHDELVSDDVLALARPGAVRIAVGKRKGRGHAQREIEAILVAQAHRHGLVVRLKGGDPFLFGRGGEERAALAAHGIAVEVVPGISSAMAAPAAIGVPVTHRGTANACTIISGHVLDDYDWSALARLGGTIVVLMGASTAHAVAGRLLAAGRPADEPVAIVRSATTPRQHHVILRLGDLADPACRVESPSVIVIGRVVEQAAVLSPALAGARCGAM